MAGVITQLLTQWSEIPLHPFHRTCLQTFWLSGRWQELDWVINFPGPHVSPCLQFRLIDRPTRPSRLATFELHRPFKVMSRPPESLTDSPGGACSPGCVKTVCVEVCNGGYDRRFELPDKSLKTEGPWLRKCWVIDADALVLLRDFRSRVERLGAGERHALLMQAVRTVSVHSAVRMAAGCWQRCRLRFEPVGGFVFGSRVCVTETLGHTCGPVCAHSGTFYLGQIKTRPGPIRRLKWSLGTR